MSSVRKFKEFFGLAPFEEEMDDAYYADERQYEAAPAYRVEPAPRTFAAAPRSYQATVVPLRLVDFKESNQIGEPFRDGDAVVFDISDMTPEDARRVVDFSAGLCFALRGDMKKLGARLFAVIPEDAEVSIYELEKAAGIR